MVSNWLLTLRISSTRQQMTSMEGPWTLAPRLCCIVQQSHRTSRNWALQLRPVFTRLCRCVTKGYVNIFNWRRTVCSTGLQRCAVHGGGVQLFKTVHPRVLIIPEYGSGVEIFSFTVFSRNVFFTVTTLWRGTDRSQSLIWVTNFL